ncbi:hypothetical protein D9M68_18430 [compost metagenome]
MGPLSLDPMDLTSETIRQIERDLKRSFSNPPEKNPNIAVLMIQLTGVSHRSCSYRK